MTFTARDRHELHSALIATIGEHPAETLMEHLPLGLDLVTTSQLTAAVHDLKVSLMRWTLGVMIAHSTLLVTVIALTR